MSTLKKDHYLGAGASALAGAAAGAAIGGMIAGPAGAVVGAAATGAAGAVLGHKAAEAMDARGDLGHFEQVYRTMPYYVADMKWDDYAPAYRLGLDSHASPDPQPRDIDALEREWDARRGGSRLLWSEARAAIEHAWQELDMSGRDKA